MLARLDRDISRLSRRIIALLGLYHYSLDLLGGQVRIMSAAFHLRLNQEQACYAPTARLIVVFTSGLLSRLAGCPSTPCSLGSSLVVLAVSRLMLARVLIGDIIALGLNEKHFDASTGSATQLNFLRRVGAANLVPIQ